MGIKPCFTHAWKASLWQMLLLLSLLIFGGMLLHSCKTDTEKIIRQQLDERKEIFRQKTLLKCQTDLTSEAEHMVDSILLAEAQASIRDSLTLQRPGRPEVPPEIPAIDSSPISPIFPIKE